MKRIEWEKGNETKKKNSNKCMMIAEVAIETVSYIDITLTDMKWRVVLKSNMITLCVNNNNDADDDDDDDG